MYKRYKLKYQELVELYPNLNIIQHHLYWKLSINSLILNWGRASNATIQPLIKLQSYKNNKSN